MAWPERLFNAEMVPAGMVQRGVELSGLPTRKVQKMMREIWKEKGSEDYDPYLLFRHARDRGLYRRSTKTEQAISELRCLALVGRVPAQNLLHNAIPTGNIIHVLERMLAQSMIREYQFMVYLLRYLLGCSARVAMTYAEHSNSLLEILRTAENNGNIDNLTMVVSLHSFYFLLDPREIHRISHQEGTSVGDFERIAEYTEAHGLASMNIARIRQWQPISRDEIQKVFDSGRGLTEQETKDEIYIRRLMKKHNIDRTDASTAFHESDRVLENANKACIEIAQNIQQKLAEELPTLPTRDTRCPPDVTAKTRVIAILGIHEEYAGAVTACPSIGDGWIVSDFYLWLHVLRGMGRSQKWITSMKPSDLVQKYGMEDKVTQVVVDADLDIRKPIQTKWKSGFVHGDPWEERRVVLDEETLPFAEQMVTVGPGGVGLRDFFLKHLELTFAEAAKFNDPVLVLMFAHGDLDKKGGLYIGTEIDSVQGVLSPKSMATINAKYPDVQTSFFMTSCYSGHWVETTEFYGPNKPTVLASTEPEQESFGFSWSHSQRHAGGLFSTATISELIQEPAQLSHDVDTSREYNGLTQAITSQMHRLFLPVNIPDYGSSPMFSDPSSQEKFWKRTGYGLHAYAQNYAGLKKIPPSDPHPKRDRKRFEAGLIDSSHPDIVAWERRHPNVKDEDYPEATAGYGSTRRGLTSNTNMKYLISRYMESQKGSERYHESKVAMNLIRAYASGSLDNEHLIILRKLLVHGISLNRIANQYALALGLYKLPEIEDWDVWDGIHSKFYSNQTFNRWVREILDSRIFHIFENQPGPFYRRPVQYLAAGMGAAGYSDNDVANAIQTLQQKKTLLEKITKEYPDSESCKVSISRAKYRQKRPSLGQLTWSSSL